MIILDYALSILFYITHKFKWHKVHYALRDWRDTHIVPRITAKPIADVSPKFAGHAVVYRLSAFVPYGYDRREKPFPPRTRYIVASAANVPYDGPETYLFPCDAEGNVLDWGELPGSTRGTLDHNRAIQEAGYKLVAPATVHQRLNAIRQRLITFAMHLWYGPDTIEPDDYSADIGSADWEALVQEAKQNTHERWDEPGQIDGSVYLGSVMSLTPSGKYYMPWACGNVEPCPVCGGSGNNKGIRSLVLGLCKAARRAVTRPYHCAKRGNLHECHWRYLFHWQGCETCGSLGSMEAYHDQLWREALEAEAEKHGGWIESGEGDPCDLFFSLVVQEAE